jgi:hypothetical protein
MRLSSSSTIDLRQVNVTGAPVTVADPAASELVSLLFEVDPKTASAPVGRPTVRRDVEGAPVSVNAAGASWRALRACVAEASPETLNVAGSALICRPGRSRVAGAPVIARAPAAASRRECTVAAAPLSANEVGLATTVCWRRSSLGAPVIE